jgi:glutamine synthetase
MGTHVIGNEVSIEAVRELLSRQQVHTVECMFADTWGIPRGKRLSAAHFCSAAGGSGFAIANVAFTWDMHGVIFPTKFVNDVTGYPDMHVVPDISTLRLAPWREGTAFCFCDTVDPDTDEPIPLDPRAILRRAAERVRSFGQEPVVATEVEFHLCDPDWEPLYTGTHCYSMQKGSEVEPVVTDIKRALEASGIEVEAWNVEYGPAQVEVNLGHGSPVAVVDATIILKYVVKQIAVKHGLRATFMPKPYITEAGNGMHIHQSLLDADGGNAFAQEDDELPLRSKLMRRYLSGLLAHQVELQAINCPTINAYKRVEDYSFAPTQVSWGLDHRLVGVRSAVGRGRATRLECRWASADANPYLVVAGCLFAGAEGLEHELEVPPMVTGDPHVDASLRRLPTELSEAVDGLEQSTFVRSTFGEMFADVYPVMLRHELEVFARHVSDLERERYREVM